MFKGIDDRARFMGGKGRTRSTGILRKYIEDSDLIEYKDGDPKPVFEHVRPEDREPTGFFDYILQTMADFGSEEMGGKHVLEFSTSRECFDVYTKIQRLNTSTLTGSVMDRYGFDLEDPFEVEENMFGGKSVLGNSLSLFVDNVDYDGKYNNHKGINYEKGLTEKEINRAIREVYKQEL